MLKLQFWHWKSIQHTLWILHFRLNCFNERQNCKDSGSTIFFNLFSNFTFYNFFNTHTLVLWLVYSKKNKIRKYNFSCTSQFEIEWLKWSHFLLIKESHQTITNISVSMAGNFRPQEFNWCPYSIIFTEAPRNYLVRGPWENEIRGSNKKTKSFSSSPRFNCFIKLKLWLFLTLVSS
jgi:hypothetical protein